MSTHNVSSIESWPIERPIPYAKNAHTHDSKQVAQIAASIVEFDFVNPILVGEDDIIIAGHGRLMAAMSLNLNSVPVIVLEHLTSAQRKALVIADNKIAENAGWNNDLLRQELEDLSNLEFDLDILGFSDEELDELLTVIEEPEQDETVPDCPTNPITQVGDVWKLGDHRIVCGDSSSGANVAKLMSGQLADMAFTDPPKKYSYDSETPTTDKKSSKKNSPKQTSQERQEFLTTVLSNLLAITKGASYITSASREIETAQTSFRDANGFASSVIIYVKNQFTQDSTDYQRMYEPILYGWRKGNDHYWCGDQTQSDVWNIGKRFHSNSHPEMLPVELVEKCIRNSSKTYDIVLDVFGGTGTTLIACENTKRSARLLEIDPSYVDVTIERWQSQTGECAIREDDSITYDELLQARGLQ